MFYSRKIIASIAVFIVVAGANDFAQSQTEIPSNEAPPPRSDAHGEPRGDHPRRPSLKKAATKLGVTEEALNRALQASGGPPPNLEKAAEVLGISVDQLKDALPPPPPRRRPR